MYHELINKINILMIIIDINILSWVNVNPLLPAF